MTADRPLDIVNYMYHMHSLTGKTQGEFEQIESE